MLKLGLIMILINIAITLVLFGGILNICMTPNDFGKYEKSWKRLVYHLGWIILTIGILLIIWIPK